MERWTIVWDEVADLKSRCHDWEHLASISRGLV
jgi:hypothetical protein